MVIKHQVFSVDCTDAIQNRRQPVYAFRRPKAENSAFGIRPASLGIWYVPSRGFNLEEDDPYSPPGNGWEFTAQDDLVSVPLFAYLLPADVSKFGMFMSQMAWHASTELAALRRTAVQVVTVLGGPYAESDHWRVFTNFCIQVSDDHG